jgi:hypothetical protein
MQPLFVRFVRGGLELEGRVFDVEVIDEALLEGVEDLGGVAAVEAVFLHHHVGGQGGLTGGDRPGVKVVDVQHVVDVHQVAAHVSEVEVVGGGLEQDLAGVAQ